MNNIYLILLKKKTSSTLLLKIKTFESVVRFYIFND